MPPIVPTLESLFFVTTAINDSWKEREAIDWAEAEQLVRLVQHELNGEHKDVLSELLGIVAYADSYEDWDCEEVGQWPERILSALTQSDKKYTYRVCGENWEVYGVHLSGEEDWVATVVTETVAKNLIEKCL